MISYAALNPWKMDCKDVPQNHIYDMAAHKTKKKLDIADIARLNNERGGNMFCGRNNVFCGCTVRNFRDAVEANATLNYHTRGIIIIRYMIAVDLI